MLCHTSYRGTSTVSESSFSTLLQSFLMLTYDNNCKLIPHYMGQFAQFELNVCKRDQTHFSQLHSSLDPDKLEG